MLKPIIAARRESLLFCAVCKTAAYTHTHTNIYHVHWWGQNRIMRSRTGQHLHVASEGVNEKQFWGMRLMSHFPKMVLSREPKQCCFSFQGFYRWHLGANCKHHLSAFHNSLFRTNQSISSHSKRCPHCFGGEKICGKKCNCQRQYFRAMLKNKIKRTVKS